MKKEKFINMFFGKTAKKRFKRVIVLLLSIALIIGFIAVVLTCSFSYDKKNGFQFGKDATKTELKFNKGE